MNFDYILRKIAQAEFLDFPFPHVEIDNLLLPEHFATLTAAEEIAINDLQSDDELFSKLFAAGYRIVEHPGCIVNLAQYRRWRRGRLDARRYAKPTCESFGLTMRLGTPKSELIVAFVEFLQSQRFQNTLKDKFGLQDQDLNYDAGIQKYLNGYEISPHPDIRRKALTFMANINPSEHADCNSHHTHYLRFLQPYEYVRVFWEGNPKMDRCWVPWEWCESCKVQNRNNSLVIFSPGNSTLHAVRARYNDLMYQRTQIYGNLWYKTSDTIETPCWNDLTIQERDRRKTISASTTMAKLLPAAFKKRIKELRAATLKKRRIFRDL